LVGVEIPILLRILKDRVEFKELVSQVFTYDYVGALFASILFPLVLVPYLGLVKSSFLFGILNTIVALWVLFALKEEIAGARYHKMAAFATLITLVFGFVGSDRIMGYAESAAYPGKIIFSQSTPYQRIVLTSQSNDLRLFLNSNLQFSSIDEYRYHEALVHPAMSAISAPKQALIIGGGDGLALREVLKYPAVEKVSLVDLDPAMTQLFSENPILTDLNQNSLSSPKVSVINQDAFLWLREMRKKPAFDVIIIDVPDPSNYSVGKLYSLTFFKLLRDLTHEDSIIVVQSTSPLVARKSFWCVNNTLEAAGFLPAAYHAFVPSFGEWGFTIASRKPYQVPVTFPPDLRFLDATTAKNMFVFPPDMAKVETEIQRLDDQVLIRYFDAEWSAHLIY
jgi:spermidine synthase